MVSITQPFLLPERPVQLLLRAPAAGYVDGQQELLEVDVAVLVGVEGAEDVVAELVGVAGGEALGVDLHEGLGGQPAVGAVGLEALVPFLEVKGKKNVLYFVQDLEK